MTHRHYRQPGLRVSLPYCQVQQITYLGECHLSNGQFEFLGRDTVNTYAARAEVHRSQADFYAGACVPCQSEVCRRCSGSTVCSVSPTLFLDTRNPLFPRIKATT